MLQQIYDGAAHLPGVTLLSVTLLFLIMGRKLPFMVCFCMFFGWLIALDAWCNGAWSPIPEASRGPFEVFFVMVGDWRYFLLVERYSGKRFAAPGWARSIAFAFIAPVVGLITIKTHPSLDPRITYLVYEITFILIPLAILMFVLPRRRGTDPEDASFLKSLTYFELLQYGLWIIADVLLYLGLSWALNIRLLANVFYYALFVPYAWWRTPQSPAFRQRVMVPVSALTIAAMVLSFTPAMRHPKSASAASAPASASLSFMEGGKQVRSVSLSPFSKTLKVEEVAAFDPYYQHNKRWRAVSIEQLMQAGFKREPSTLVDDEFVLRAQDGFAAYFPGRRLLEGGAYVAIADFDQPDWEPIGPRKDNPGPFYLVWAKPDQLDLETHARPWQMASIEIVEFDNQFPHVRPAGPAIPQSALRGFETFRVQCLPCHAINRSGGRIGPELNVPRNILEYRDPSVVEAFIKNPLEFRYTVMPAHPNMTDSDLQDLIAYFRVMKTQKNDKDAPKGREH